MAPGLLLFSYAYFCMGMVLMMIPMMIFYKKNPETGKQAGMMGVYFSYLYFLYLLTAVKLHHWLYPGEYLGWIEIVGLGFPLEEFLFWVPLSPMCIVAYYRFFE